MDKKTQKSIFNIAVLSVFGLGILIAVAMFAGNNNATSTPKAGQLIGSVSVWGTLPYQVMKNSFDALQSTQKDLRVNYVEKKPETFETELVNALASGTGPDIFMITPETVLHHKPRLFMIPFTSLPEKSFKDTYIDQSRLFVFKDGIAGFPMTVDPLVMYVNQDMLSAAFLVNAPKTWTELVSMRDSLTKISDTGQINQSMIALGGYANVMHADKIITTLLLQTGEKITALNTETGEVVSTLGSVTDSGADQVFDFYTSFSNKNSDTYTWNTAQRNNRDLFIAGKLPLYIGFASELPVLRTKNPNLNFDIHMVPMPETGGKKTVYGNMNGWGVSKLSKNSTLAVAVLQMISTRDIITSVLSATWIAPARRDMLQTLPPDDAVRSLIYSAAIVANSYWNPNVSIIANSLEKNINQVNAGSINPLGAYNNWYSDIIAQLRNEQPK